MSQPTLSIPASLLPSTATVIFLHGLGQTNSSWMSWLTRLAQSLPTVHWILPQAETGHVSYSSHVCRPRWFDVHDLPPNEEEDDRHGAAASNNYIQQVVQDVIDNPLYSQKVFLVGFSQGSAMCLLSGLTSRHTLSGIAVLSGWLPLKLREIVLNSSPTTCPPIFWAHGTSDREIPLQIALEVMQWLRSSFAVEKTGLECHEYPGLEHDVNYEVMHDLHIWLSELL